MTDLSPTAMLANTNRKRWLAYWSRRIQDAYPNDLQYVIEDIASWATTSPGFDEKFPEEDS